MGGTEILCRAMNASAEAHRHGDILAILDRRREVERGLDLETRRSRRKNLRSLLAALSRGYLYAMTFVGPEVRPDTLTFPDPSAEIDYGEVHCLWNAFVLMKRDQQLEKLLTHFEERAQSESRADRVHAGCVLACLRYWNDEREAAAAAMAQAMRDAPADPELLMMQARLLDLCEKPKEALAVLDRIEAGDARMMQERELAAIRLAVTIGSVEAPGSPRNGSLGSG